MSQHVPLSLSRCLLSEIKRVWEGILGIRDFTRNIGFDKTPNSLTGYWILPLGMSRSLSTSHGLRIRGRNTEIRDAGIPQDSREKWAGMRDQDPLSDPFTPFYESK